MNLLESILKKIPKFRFLIFLILIPISLNAEEKWIIDKNISKISFEVPVLFATNVKGEFKDIEGYVYIDLKEELNNKAIFSVKISSIDINYKKYLDLILSEVFFDANKYPIAVLDTKKFGYKNEEKILLNIEITIKGITKSVPLELEITNFTNELVQVRGKLEFSRNDFNIGTGQWRNTTILKDNIKLEANIFLIKE